MKKVLVTGDFDIDPSFIPKGMMIEQIRNVSSNEEIKKALGTAWAYVVGGPEYFSTDLMEAANELKELVVMGTGTSSFVDLDSALKKGIHVSNTPHLNADAVAEFTLATLIHSLAQTFHSIDGVKSGSSWLQSPRKTLKNLQVGILGMGAIGEKLIEKLSLLGVQNFSYYSRSRKLDLEKKYALEFLKPEKLLKKVDVLSIHMTYAPETHHLLNSDLFSQSRGDLKILNFSHPHIINPGSLKLFLEKNPAAFCFIDGYYQEWIENKGIEKDPYGLLALSSHSFVATSHMAAQETHVIQNILAEAFKILNIQLKKENQ